LASVQILKRICYKKLYSKEISKYFCIVLERVVILGMILKKRKRNCRFKTNSFLKIDIFNVKHLNKEKDNNKELPLKVFYKSSIRVILSLTSLKRLALREIIK
jgi:hypothetical protein